MLDKRTQAGKKLYSIPEIYGIAVKAFRSAGDMARAQKAGIMSAKLRERIMLAVTAVNACPMCSYAHTEMALKAGLNESEIKALVSGEFPELPPAEIKAVLFAQHYADSRGKPAREVWQEVVSAYGRPKAYAILGAARMIMLGNAVGIVLSSIKGRFGAKGADVRSNIVYEIAVMLSLPLIMPLGLVQALISNVIGAPIIRF